MEEVVFTFDSTAAALKLTIRDLVLFINWMHHAHRAFEHGGALPSTPELESEQVKSWVQLVQKLEDRFRRSEGKQMSLEANLQAQEQELGRLLSHLHSNIATLYENLGQDEKAQEIRRRASLIHYA